MEQPMKTPFSFYMSEESMRHMEARNGQLVETTAEGTVRVMRSIAKPISVTIGAKRTRAPKA